MLFAPLRPRCAVCGLPGWNLCLALIGSRVVFLVIIIQRVSTSTSASTLASASAHAAPSGKVQRMSSVKNLWSLQRKENTQNKEREMRNEIDGQTDRQGDWLTDRQQRTCLSDMIITYDTKAISVVPAIPIPIPVIREIPTQSIL